MADTTAGYNQLTSRRSRKEKIEASRRDNQSNPRETSEVSATQTYSKVQTDGYLSEAFYPDEYYRKGVKEENNSTRMVIARQIQEKVESYASIRLVRQARMDSSKSFKQFEEETNIIPPYTRFFLQNTSHANQEKYQIVQTFRDFKIFFYGKQPVIKNYSGYLLNAKNQDWMQDFEYVYENYLRGTKSVELNALTYLTFDNVIVEGYVINSQFNQTALEQNGVPFSFSMIVLDRVPVNIEDVRLRNRVTDTLRNRNQVIDNQKKLPSAALEKMRQFFNRQKVVTGK